MVAAVLVIAAGVFIGPAPANAEGEETTRSVDSRASWDCWAYEYGDGRGLLTAGCSRSGETFKARFDPYGEHLWVDDCFPNDHHTYAYLTTPDGIYTRHHGRCDNARDFNLRIPEGDQVGLTVCSSQLSGRKCSPTVYGEA
jgi:hypothetical protein